MDATLDAPPRQVDQAVVATAEGGVGRETPGSETESGPLAGIPRTIGPYEILGELGRGGMGAVYKAWHPRLKRVTALKMILAGEHASPAQTERFLVEAQAIAKLVHPGIVQIYEIGQHHGLPYFSLEYVDGKTLSAEVARRPLAPERAALITAELAASVAYAHRQGVLHRDIKPGNVLLTADGVPKLTDFGLAKRTSDDPSEPRTADGTVLGTPSYMPPEQARGDTAEIGPAADQYSLGALLYHLLTGRPPFVAPRAVEVVMQVLHQEPVAPRELQPSTPLDLETICLKALSKEPARRYASCAELEADLRRFLRHEPIVARPVGMVERLWRWCRRNPRVAIPLATTFSSLLLALGVSIWSIRSLEAKNRDIEAQRTKAIAAKNTADENARRADANAQRADENAAAAAENAQTALQRAREAKLAVMNMLRAIRVGLPPVDERLIDLRMKMMKIASDELDRLPDSEEEWDLQVILERMRLLELQYLTFLDLGQPSKAAELLEQAEPMARNRNRLFGTDSTRFNLMTILLRHAEVRQSYRRDMEIVRHQGQEALELLEGILAQPKPVEFSRAQGSMPRIEVITQVFPVSYQYALTLRKLGRVEEALTVVEKGIAYFDEAMTLVRSQPNFREMPDDAWLRQKEVFRGMLAEQYQLRLLLLLSVGRSDEARQEQLRILDGARRVLQNDASPDKTLSRDKLSQSLYLAGDVLRATGDAEGARSFYTEALELARKLYQENPRLEQRRNKLNICLVRLAGSLRDSDPEQAVALYQEALAVARDMVKADDQGESKHVAVALALPFTGEHAAAAELAESILKRVERLDAELQIDMARTFAGCCWAAAKSDPAQSERYRARAIELLTAAVESGYHDAVYLRNHPDYDPLRDSESFQALLSRIGSPAGRPGAE
ncbi:MAG: serine/threonine-protein kinase [Pirellulales bacterium]